MGKVVSTEYLVSQLPRTSADGLTRPIVSLPPGELPGIKYIQNWGKVDETPADPFEFRKNRAILVDAANTLNEKSWRQLLQPDEVTV